jgi:hypothetical protein
MPTPVKPKSEPVNRFAMEAAPSGEPIVNRFTEPPIDFSKIGEFDAKHASEGQQWKLALGYLTTPSTKARADIIRKVLPGASIQLDPNNGREVVSYKGEVGYIDKPGVTFQGIVNTAGQILKYLPVGKAAGAGGSLLTRSLIAGGAAALTSAAEDAAAIPQGSEQGISPEKALTTGAIAGVAQPVGELVIQPGIGWLTQRGVHAWRAIRGTPQAATPDGTLTGLGRRLAEEAGLDPDQITPQLADELERAARQATAAALPDEQIPGATTRQALSQRFRTPMTRGELTQDYRQQSLEENLRRMDVTTRAGQIMRDAEGQSAQALRGATGESGFGLLRREVGGTTATDVADAGQQVISATQAQAAAARGAYQGAYRTAREAGASLDARAYKGFLQDTETVLKDAVDYDPNLYPQTAKMLENLRGRLVFMEETGRSAPRQIPLAKLENIRKIINAQWKSADATDRMGLDILRNQFDEMVNGALDAGRVRGPAESVDAWRAGRALYQRFQELYSANPRAGQAEQTAGRTVADWLRSGNATGEDAIRKAVQSPALTRRILGINGADSPAHAALKQGALEYVFRPALKNEGISPRLVVSQYDRWFRGSGREQMEAIFSARERAAIGEFAQLARAKVPMEGVVNYSNTGNVLVKSAQQLLQRLGVLSAATGHVEVAGALGAANALQRAAATNQARGAVRGLVPADRVTPAIVSGASGVTSSRSGAQE